MAKHHTPPTKKILYQPINHFMNPNQKAKALLYKSTLSNNLIISVLIWDGTFSWGETSFIGLREAELNLMMTEVCGGWRWAELPVVVWWRSVELLKVIRGIIQGNFIIVIIDTRLYTSWCGKSYYIGSKDVFGATSRINDDGGMVPVMWWWCMMLPVVWWWRWVEEPDVWWRYVELLKVFWLIVSGLW